MKIYNTNHISTINFTNHLIPYIMDIQSFEYTRDLEKQVITLQNTIARLLSDVRSLELDTEIAEGERDAILIERDAWMGRACDLQCK